MLNALAGSEKFTKQVLAGHADTLLPFLFSEADLEDKHAAFQSLRSCFEVYKMGFHLPVVPPSFALKDATEFDRNIKRCLHSLAGGILDSVVPRELQLPVKAEDAKSHALKYGSPLRKISPRSRPCIQLGDGQAVRRLPATANQGSRFVRCNRGRLPKMSSGQTTV